MLPASTMGAHIVVCINPFGTVFRVAKTDSQSKAIVIKVAIDKIEAII